MRLKTLLIGGAVIAAGAAALWKREKVAALLPTSSESQPQPQPPVPARPPEPSNYDAVGPIANTATPVPAPEPQVRGDVGLDEAAEEAAAAAEAANIGGTVSDYAGPTGERADEAERPLAEAGEGEAEGEEQAEFELEQAAEPTAPGVSDEERQIEDAIEAAENPAIGEREEAADSPAEFGEADAPRKEDDSSNEGGNDWQTWSGRSVNP
jgi:hypothetical protein